MIHLSQSAHRKLEAAIARGWTPDHLLGPCEFMRRRRMEKRDRKRRRGRDEP